MISATYQAGICSSEGIYGVVFPDLLGCVSAGDTVEQAVAMAHEALALHLEGMVEDGDPLPVATHRTLEDIAREFDDPEDPTGEVWVTVVDISVQIPENDTIPIRVKADLIQKIADFAESTAVRIDSRRFIEEAVEHEIERHRKSAA